MLLAGTYTSIRKCLTPRDFYNSSTLNNRYRGGFVFYLNRPFTYLNYMVAFILRNNYVGKIIYTQYQKDFSRG